jgi:hypothetical protein
MDLNQNESVRSCTQTGLWAQPVKMPHRGKIQKRIFLGDLIYIVNDKRETARC